MRMFLTLKLICIMDFSNSPCSPLYVVKTLSHFITGFSTVNGNLVDIITRVYIA